MALSQEVCPSTNAALLSRAVMRNNAYTLNPTDTNGNATSLYNTPETSTDYFDGAGVPFAVTAACTAGSAVGSVDVKSAGENNPVKFSGCKSCGKPMALSPQSVAPFSPTDTRKWKKIAAIDPAAKLLRATLSWNACATADDISRGVRVRPATDFDLVLVNKSGAVAYASQSNDDSNEGFQVDLACHHRS